MQIKISRLSFVGIWEKMKKEREKDSNEENGLSLTLSDANTWLCQRAMHDAHDGLHSRFLQKGTMVTIDYVN